LHGLGPIVSVDLRNFNERARTILAIPLTTSVHKAHSTQIVLSSGETGLGSDSAARGENITVISKSDLVPPRQRLGQISHTKTGEICRPIQIAVGCP
jgi:mRNA-degrading endonuclease toxin of MazEF toxin-antitoxin module